ncbi:MAG: dNTP triphosphohydrolase, partial [Nitrospinota bacterium]|nr:dNTP triphosphohydrolase [Nitrospinota bacterium]
MINRQDIEKLENDYLAPFAVKSGESWGRASTEEEHPYRTRFQRDRDRVIHTSAFRKLEYKTQVFVYHEGDYYRTRLTHSLEVAQITRSICKSLQLNEDLAEAIALAHDLGHPPFGHTGQDVLNTLMKDQGGFEHNKQSLRIVKVLEKRYPEFEGLNLTWEVQEGISKHSKDTDNPLLNETGH